MKTKILKNKKPSSYPFISSDTLRTIANHIHDFDKTFNVQDVKSGDIIVVNNDLIKEYLRTKHKEIKNKYILIGVNSDTNIDQEIANLIDQNIIKFYAQDVIAYNPKIIPIPMGLENLSHYSSGIVSVYKRLIKKTHYPKKNRIFFKFNLRTNPKERTEAQNYLLNHNLAETFEHKIPPTLHAKIVMKYKFIASPPGHTIESGKTWEALYMKTVPIVKDNVAMKYFAELGIPLWVISDWHNLDGLSEKDLENKYNDLMSNANFKPLYMDYWIEEMKKDQNNIK